MRIDDSEAKNNLNWKPQYNLETMANDMIRNLKLEFICKP